MTGNIWTFIVYKHNKSVKMFFIVYKHNKSVKMFKIWVIKLEY